MPHYFSTGVGGINLRLVSGLVAVQDRQDAAFRGILGAAVK